MITDERRLEQTRWAWINEYGPVRAEALLAALTALREAEPSLPLREAIDRIDPENEGDFEVFCASRW
jgi:hypothetical protein